jgi:Cytochrome c554 and c-prime
MISLQAIARYLIAFKFYIVVIYIICYPSYSAHCDETQTRRYAYMGVGSCSSSNCHGSVSPRESSNILQNEYVTWQKHDSHSKAWLSLTNEDSKKIASNLGIKNPESEPLCLKCHTTYLEQNDISQDSKYNIEDGVSCESCHGAAEKYLGPHTTKDNTYNKNIENGMKNIAPLEQRSKLCISCHMSNEDKFVNHRLIGAGHPRLSFELDTFSMIQPKHWIVDEDYKKRKEDYSPVKAWLIGQQNLSEQTIDRLLSSKLSNDGIFPELSIFYCYSCHHSLKEAQWKTRDYGSQPGELELNISSLVILREALFVIDKKTSENLRSVLTELHSKYKVGNKDSLSNIKEILNKSRKLFESTSYDKNLTNRLLRQVISYCANNKWLQYEVAEQIAMGASSLISELDPSGKVYKTHIDNLYKTLKESSQFNPDSFTNACNSFAAAL